MLRQNKTECNFSRESSSSKSRAIQKQTNNLAAAGWVLPEECMSYDAYTVKSPFFFLFHHGQTKIPALLTDAAVLPRATRSPTQFPRQGQILDPDVLPQGTLEQAVLEKMLIWAVLHGHGSPQSFSVRGGPLSQTFFRSVPWSRQSWSERSLLTGAVSQF